MSNNNFTLFPIKEINHTKYDTLLSCSLFKMIEGYKNFEIEYIEPLLKWIYKIPKNSFVRMYVDASILDENGFKKILDMNIPHLEVILYQFNSFLKEDGVHHDGTFGSMVRMLPLYKQFRPKNIKYVWITDIDMPVKVFNYKYIDKMEKKKIPITFYSKGCYNKPWSDTKIKYPIGIGRFITSTKVNYEFKDFENYLLDIINGKYKNIYEKIKEYYVSRNSQNQIKTFEHIKYFPYGFDELFVNNFLAKKISIYRRIVIFDINLNEFYKETLTGKDKREYHMLFSFSWENIRPMNKELKTKLIELNKKISDRLKDKPEMNVDYCIRDFDENYKKVDFNEIGLMANIIVEPKIF